MLAIRSIGAQTQWQNEVRHGIRMLHSSTGTFYIFILLLFLGGGVNFVIAFKCFSSDINDSQQVTFFTVQA